MSAQPARARYDIKVTGDSIEVVDLIDLEVVLFWDCHARPRRRMAEALRHDRDRLTAEAFLERWSSLGPEAFA